MASVSKIEFHLSAAEFSRMGWVLKHLGPKAIIYPGQQQHARAAIQYLSGAILQQRIFAHVGWAKQGDDWVYLHAGGALGSQGFRDDLRVQLPDSLKHFRFSRQANSQSIVESIRASFEFLSLAPDRITFPLLAAVYRAPLGDLDFSVFLTGRTGTFKSSLAALCQQHYGPEMNATNLPANFASTANALEALAYYAKDAVMVVDDFVPTGGIGDNALENVAERLFRAAGNHQGRSRLSANGRVRSSLPPRGLLIATGEDVPHCKSLRGRMLIIDIEAPDVSRSQLSVCQTAAVRGQFAAAMAAYLTWVAPRYEELKQRLEERVRELVLEHQQHSQVHARLPKILAELQA